MGRGRLLLHLHGREAGKLLAEGLLDPFLESDGRGRAARAGPGQLQADRSPLHAEDLHLAAVGMDVGADRLQGRLGRRELVDPDPVGIQQPGDGRVGVPEALEGVGPDTVGEAAERHPMQQVDAVKQLEHRSLGRLVQPLDLGQ